MQPVAVYHRVAAGRQRLHVFDAGRLQARMHPGAGGGDVVRVLRQGAHARNANEGEQLVDYALLLPAEIAFPVHK